MLIRASYTTHWPDCPRRMSARMFPSEVRSAGYNLRDTAPSIGASVGTATHASIASCMRCKISSEMLGNATEDEQRGLESLKEQISQGVQWDPTTPNLNTGEKQVLRQYRAFRVHVAEELHPVAIEERLECRTARGNTLSGQADLDDGGVFDHKTGINRRSNMAQFGCYSLLRRANGHGVEHITENFIARVALDKEQPPPQLVYYDPDVAERVAAAIVQDIEDRYARFAVKQDNLIFMANPNSQLCSARWCPAFHTDYCPESRMK